MMNRKIISMYVTLCFLVIFSGKIYAAEGMIEKVSFQGNNGKNESVVFHLNGPWLPKMFALKGDNPRVVFDFMDTDFGADVPVSINADGAMVRKIRLGRHSNKTRVVVDLVKNSDVNFDQQFDESNNVLTINLIPLATDVESEVIQENVEQVIVKELAQAPLVTVQSETIDKEIVETVAVKEAVTPQQVQKKNKPVSDPLLSDVSYENTSDKGEMVLFKLNGFYPPTVTGKEESTPLVICEFPGARLGDAVRLEQEIHGKFIQQVDVKQIQGSNSVRVTIELAPNNNYDLQQVFFKEDNLFVIIVNTYDSKK